MKKQPTGEPNATEQGTVEQTLSEAVRAVNAAIAQKTERFEEIVRTEEQEPILLEGETRTGYLVKTLIDPGIAAKVMLRYDCPAYLVLGEDLPQGMWNELAEIVGLETVSFVELS